MPSEQEVDVADARAQRWATLALVIAILLLFFTRLDCPLLEPEETRYAEIPRQMLVEGSWLVPIFHGQPYYDKPPLMYWLVMLSYGVFGVHDWAARLVPSFAGAATVIATYLWGQTSVTPRAALAGAFMLCLCPRFVYLGRMLTMNGLLGLFVVLALAAGHQALIRPTLRWRWWFLSAAACGLGVLAKGPVALVLTVVPIGAYQVWDKCVVRPRPLPWIVYVAVAAALACPWFLAVAVRDPSFLTYFFWTHHLVRYVAPLDHEQPVWYYVPGVLLGALPWTLLLPGAIRDLWRARGDRAPGPTGIFALSAFWCLAFYSLSGCKRSGYILPVFPPLALALGWRLDRVLSAYPGVSALWRSASRHSLWATRIVVVCGLGCIVAAGVSGLLNSAQLLATWAITLATGMLAALKFRRRAASWGTCGLASFAAMMTAVAVLLPAYANRFSLRAEVAPFTSEGEAFAVACYPHRWDSVDFYLQRGDVRAFSSANLHNMMASMQGERRTLLFVKSHHSLGEVLRELPSSLEFRPCSRHPWVTTGWVQPRR